MAGSRFFANAWPEGRSSGNLERERARVSAELARLREQTSANVVAGSHAEAKDG